MVDPGPRVPPASGGLDERPVLALGHVRRTLEHQVLEQVRKPGPSRLFMPAPHVISDDDGDDRHIAVSRQDDPKAVLQLVPLDRDFVHRSVDRDGVSQLQLMILSSVAGHPPLVPPTFASRRGSTT
jgi:hypothetical protein